jgi:hypothetical protein
MLGGCGNQDGAGGALPQAVGARALSNHYVEVMLSGQVDASAETPSMYRIQTAAGDELTVHGVQRTGNGDRIILLTDAQEAVAYEFVVVEPPASADARIAQTAQVAFTGSTLGEPRLINAVPLNNTTVLLTFDGPMNVLTAQKTELYRIAAPDEFPESNVRITAAALGADEMTVVLTTTPQAYVEYTVFVNNLEAKYQPVIGCNGESVDYLSSSNQCSASYRPFSADGISSSVVASARTQVNPNGPTDPEAAGVAARLYLNQITGGGVKTAACGGSESGFIEGSGTVSDEEVTLDLDVAIQQEAIVIKLLDLSFTADDPVLFLSSSAAPGFDFTLNEAAITAATLQFSATEGYLFFADLGLPAATMIDRIRLRETKGFLGLGSICLTGKVLIDPTHASASFFGIPPVDNVKPSITGAAALDEHTVLVNFSEPVGVAAGDATNYALAPELTIMGAEQNAYKTQVKLTTLAMTAGQEYVVSAGAAIPDLAIPPNMLDGTANHASFTFKGAAGASDPSLLLPRLTGAISTSNRTVVVSFNKAMSDSVLTAANYFIIQENVNPEVGYVAVTDVAFLGDSRKSVVLATASQSELTYRLTVVNVEDLQGNALAPKELLVDPASVLFPGTPATCGPKRCATGSGNPGGIDSNGVCETDDDCDNDAPCNSAEADCEAKCEDPCETVDFDGDGLTDAEEQRGWEVAVELATKRGEHDERETVRRQVTSSPLVADSDRDGLDDRTEKTLTIDPRDKDTDDDQVEDEPEYNLYYSNPADQDSDDDDTDDYLEITFFQTSPNMPDTDGDQLDDSEELYELSRNPLIADLPLPQITVQDISLDLNITSSYTDEQGVTTSLSETTSSTFTQSRTNSIGTTDTTTTQNEAEFGQEIAAEGGTAGWKVSGKATFGQSLARGYSSTVDRQSSETSQREYQNSVTSALEQSERRSVTREINSAIVQATVNLGNQSNLAFSIKNLEISLLQQDRLTGLTFRPIAALRATGASATDQPTFNLAPLEQERGPIIFENTEVFPNRIDALMREPTGLIFQVVNFDVLDEAGRNLVFTSQDVSDRTAGITIDFGDGRVESYRVATASIFGDNGKMIGITMERALEIVGILKDDVGSGIDDTYETILDTRTVGSNSVQVEALTRIRDVENTNDGLKFWAAVASNTDLDPNEDFSTIQLQAHDSILLLYTSDVDTDGLFLREEYLYGSEDTSSDSDGDTLGDFEEVREGWTVAKVPGLPYATFPSPARPDSDLDGLRDDVEKFAATDPNRSDTDEDGLSDNSELLDTFTIALFDGDLDQTNTVVLTVSPFSDQAIVAGPGGICDTTTASGDDALVSPVAAGTNSKLCVSSGANGIIDTAPLGNDVIAATAKISPGPNGQCNSATASGDDVLETSSGNTPANRGSLGALCISAGANGIIDTPPTGDDYVRVAHKGLYATDPVRFDTDLDGIGDGREVLLGINPNSRDAGAVVDTDGDGLFDQEEDDGWIVRGTTTLVTSDKNQPDTDRDGIPDVIERAIGSNPRNLDTDNDTLLDIKEFNSSNATNIYDAVALASALQKCSDAPHCEYTPPQPSQITGTDPAKADTDGDTRNDNIELNVGWTVALYIGTSTQVFSDPRYADHDNDGLNDAAELTNTTDPEDADTDDDGRNDGVEVTKSLNPLRKDKRISVTLVNVNVVGDCDASTFRGLELEGSFQVTKPDGSGDIALYTFGCNGEEGACEVSDCCIDDDNPGEMACEGQAFTVGTNSGDFIFRDGETVGLKSGTLYDHDDLGCGVHGLDEEIGSVNDSLPFSVSLVSSKAVTVGSGGCQITVNYSFPVTD